MLVNHYRDPTLKRLTRFFEREDHQGKVVKINDLLGTTLVAAGSWSECCAQGAASFVLSLRIWLDPPSDPPLV